MADRDREIFRKGGILLNALIVSMHHEKVFAEYAVKAGAKGYLMKDQIPEALVFAIRRILNGDLYLSDSVLDKVVNSFIRKQNNTDSFTARQYNADQKPAEVYGAYETGRRNRLAGSCEK